MALRLKERSMPSLLLTLSLIASPDPLIGTWTALHPARGLPAEGILEVEPREGSLRARFRGEWIDGVSEGEGTYTLRFVGAGQARLRTSLEGYRGFWVQPETATSQAYATPLRFEPQAGGRARARLNPYQERRPLVLRIRSDGKGGTKVLAREGEGNLAYRLALTSAQRSGTRVVFESRRDHRVTGELSQDGETLQLHLPGDSEPVLLARSSETRVRGLHARIASLGPSGVPDAAGHWPVAAPQARGMSRETLDRLVIELATAEPKSIYDPMVHALLVARSGSLVLEEYFFDHGPERFHDTRSAGKSINSMLVGALAERRKLEVRRLMAKPLCELASKYPACSRDPRKSAITLGHVLSMNTGFDCDDNDYATPGHESRMQDQSEEADWHRYMLGVPMARAPGEKAVYCTGAINLSGLALRALGKASIPELFDTWLARPLGIERYHWNLAPNGVGYLGGGVRLRPRDLLKLGEVMRKDGAWKGHQLLPRGWAALSTRAHSSVNETDDYGYGWWRKSYAVEGVGTVSSFYASGNGGQLLFVVPQLELVVLFLGGNYGNYGTWRHFRDDYLPRILAAVEP